VSRRKKIIAAVLSLLLVIAIGGTVYALVVGSHTIIPGKEVVCAKCHQTIQDEVKASHVEAHKNKNCQDCHQAGTHSTTLPENLSELCVSCHPNEVQEHSQGGHQTVECYQCHSLAQ
jgi:hypothetical protein